MKQLFSRPNSSTSDGLLKVTLSHTKSGSYANYFSYRAASAYLKLAKNMPRVLSFQQLKDLLAKRCLNRIILETSQQVLPITSSIVRHFCLLYRNVRCFVEMQFMLCEVSKICLLQMQ